MAQFIVEYDAKDILAEMELEELKEFFQEIINDFDDCFFYVLNEYMKGRRKNMDKFKIEIIKELFEDYYSKEELIEKIIDFILINY